MTSFLHISTGILDTPLLHWSPDHWGWKASLPSLWSSVFLQINWFSHSKTLKFVAWLHVLGHFCCVFWIVFLLEGPLRPQAKFFCFCEVVYSYMVAWLIGCPWRPVLCSVRWSVCLKMLAPTCLRLFRMALLVIPRFFLASCTASLASAGVTFGFLQVPDILLSETHI